MSNQLIECVPNFSEGNDSALIKQITDQIESVDGVKLLDVDPGKATNRTVVTFVGTPDAVIDAAVLAGKKSAELIDMSKHSGEHPRFGAMDVCPLVPVSNITMEETVKYAHILGKRLGKEAGLTVYCYENAARKDDRHNLATVRSGEYEGLKDKLADPHWAPDFGPAKFNAQSGATAVGARDFLVAYNINLNTTAAAKAHDVAIDIREGGRAKRDPNTGKIMRDEDGNRIMIPGPLKCVKAIGWYIEEFGIAQISINLTNINVTSVHVAFDLACTKATEKGMRVTGSELVGLIPLNAMLDAGRYFLKKQGRSLGVSNAELIKIAVKSLGLDDLYKFVPEEKIIEYAMADKNKKQLIDFTLKAFVEETASESPAPGGGSISAAAGAMGAALGTMVANLSAAKKGKEWQDRLDEFSDWAVKGKQYHDTLLRLIDEDTEAFNQIMDCFAMPKNSDADKVARDAAIQTATQHAIEIPFRVMEVAYESMQVMKAMAESGNPNSVSDAGVGALCARTAVMGAFLNVKINSGDLEDKKAVEGFITRGKAIEEKTIALEREILEIVNSKM